LGLKGAGKTTILQNLKHDEISYSHFFIGFSVKEIRWGKRTVLSWDVGEEEIVGCGRHYFLTTKYFIFVIDSCDVARFNAARTALEFTLRFPELKGVPLLVLCNKQDLLNSVAVDEIVQHFELFKLDVIWRALACCAVTGEGIEEGLDWLETITAQGSQSSQEQ
jgi:GTPase SAR1 family protein